MKDYLFAEDQEVVSNKFINMDIPQGPATVCLFQRNPRYATIAPMALALMLNMDPSKMPSSPDQIKYDYGTFVRSHPSSPRLRRLSLHGPDLGGYQGHAFLQAMRYFQGSTGSCLVLRAVSV